jgi:membrane protease YdiL (CAAX protease family)
MKQCSYCGATYADDVERCLIDNEILPGSGVQLVPPPLPLPVSAQVVAVSEPVAKPEYWTEQRLLIIEVAMVCLIVFGGSILTSTHHFIYGYDSTSSETSSSAMYGWTYRIEREVAGLFLVWYLLLRRHKSFRDLGLVWRIDDLVWAVVLVLADTISYRLIYNAIYHAGFTAVPMPAASQHIGQILFGSDIVLTTILFQFLNPFFEELIVRAYLMTEIKFLTKSAAYAILASTLLQTSYHFYQGAPAALAHGVAFLMFSIFYAKTNRIMPVILAHLYADMNGPIWYMLHR